MVLGMYTFLVCHCSALNVQVCTLNQQCPCLAYRLAVWFFAHKEGMFERAVRDKGKGRDVGGERERRFEVNEVVANATAEGEIVPFVVTKQQVVFPTITCTSYHPTDVLMSFVGPEQFAGKCFGKREPALANRYLLPQTSFKAREHVSASRNIFGSVFACLAVKEHVNDASQVLCVHGDCVLRFLELPNAETDCNSRTGHADQPDHP
jgi:hypothetical protein